MSRSAAAGAPLAELLGALGAPPHRALDIDLRSEDGPGRWFVAACLLADRVPEAKALAAFRALDAAGLGSLGAYAQPAPSPDAAAARAADELARAEIPHPERVAVKLLKAARALEERYAGSFERLAGGAEGIEDLAQRVARLASGVGAATVVLFLQPLRDEWPAALELPLSRAARAAAIDLGLIDASEDTEGEPGALRRALANAPGAPALADVEPVLERLGRLACLRGRTSRCPLGPSCGHGRVS